MELVAPALKILATAGISAKCLAYQYSERGGIADAAVRLGLPPHSIIKSLVFDDGNGENPVMALMHGDGRVSTRKLERVAGLRRLMPSSPENARRITGYEPGGISPFGLVRSMPICAQESIFELGVIYINAGRRGIVAEIEPSALDILEILRGDIEANAR